MLQRSKNLEVSGVFVENSVYSSGPLSLFWRSVVPFEVTGKGEYDSLSDARRYIICPDLVKG